MTRKAYDLFCGAGGASLGLAAAGYEVHGFELWDVACQSHRENVGPCEEVDLNTHDWSSWDTPDLLWASPPCQPFSAAGKGLADADPRDCIPAFLRAVRELLPPVVIMENVRGLTFKKNRPYLDLIVKDLEEQGYQVEWRLLNCADYGIPQTRVRFFLVAALHQSPNWPLATHAKVGTDTLEPWVSMAAALGWGMSARPAYTVPHGSPQGGPDGFGGSGAREGIAKEREAGRWVLSPGLHPSYANRRTYGPDEPAPCIAFGHNVALWRWEWEGEGSPSDWRVNTNTGQPKGTTERYGRSMDEPAPTVTTQGKWTLEGPQAAAIRRWKGSGMVERGKADRWLDTETEPAPTITTHIQNVLEQPATTVSCDPRIAARNHHEGSFLTGTQTVEEAAGPEGDEAKPIKLTVPQAAALQSFPEWFAFVGSKTHQFHQIGNAVPPPMAYLLAVANEQDDDDGDMRDVPQGDRDPQGAAEVQAQGRPVAGVPAVQERGQEAEGGRGVRGAEDDGPGLVLAASYWPTNGALIRDCAQLGYLRKEWVVLDPTYGRGLWWTEWKPRTLVHPQRSKGWDFTAMHYEDDTFDAVAYDPPYVAKGGRTTSGIQDMDARYGLEDTPATPALLQDLISDGLGECARVVKPGGYILVKCKDYVSSGKLWLGTLWTANRGIGFYGLELVDRLEHLSKSGGPQPGGRRQVHARRNLSTLLVFRKPLPKRGTRG